jgi:hypothetical protein
MLLKVEIIIYYLATVFGHKGVNEFVDILYKRFSYSGMDRVFMYLFAFLFLITFLWFMLRNIKRVGRGLTISLSLLILPIIVYYFLFFVSSVEAIHFVQYAILSAAFLRVYPSVSYVFISTSILGVVDEMYQYFVLYRGTNDAYLDYNDMLFNIHGCVIGLVLSLI